MIEGGSSNLKDIKAGNYRINKLCLEPTSFTVKEESQFKGGEAEFTPTKLMTRLTYTLDEVPSSTHAPPSCVASCTAFMKYVCMCGFLAFPTSFGLAHLTDTLQLKNLGNRPCCWLLDDIACVWQTELGCIIGGVQISGAFNVDGSGNVNFVEEDGIDYAAVTVQLPGGERVPFLFTIKELNAKVHMHLAIHTGKLGI